MNEATHVANPVRVKAARIVGVTDITKREEKCGQSSPDLLLQLEDGRSFQADSAMTARYVPEPGDYLVEQEDGYVYLNPREVFERKYQPLGSRVTFAEDLEIDEFLRGVSERAIDRGERMDMAAVVYGSYGGVIRVDSIVSGVECIGLLRIGEQIMLNTIMPNGNITN